MDDKEIVNKLSEYNDFNEVNSLISRISIDKIKVEKLKDFNDKDIFIYSMIINDDMLLSIGVYSDDLKQDTWFNLYSKKMLIISDFKTMDWIVNFIVSTQKKIRENGI